MDALRTLIDNWILLAQALIGSIGALAFSLAPLLVENPLQPLSLLCPTHDVEPKSSFRALLCLQRPAQRHQPLQHSKGSQPSAAEPAAYRLSHRQPLATGQRRSSRRS